MSTLAVTLEQVKNVRKHPNADRLMLVDVLGWTVVTSVTNNIKEGDRVVYFPIDSVLPRHIEARIFGADSKIKLDKGRIKTIALRGEYSQGLIVPWEEAQHWPELPPKELVVDGGGAHATVLTKAYAIGEDLTARLGVEKYTLPWEARLQIHREALKAAQEGRWGKLLKRKARRAALSTREMPRYTDLEHLARYPDSFVPGEPVVVTEKLHGTSARYARIRGTAKTTWQRVLGFFGIKPAYGFVYGSRNVEYLGDPPLDGNAPTEDQFWQNSSAARVYGGIARRLGLHDFGPDARLLPGEIVYGEIVGTNIQKNYAYGAPRRTGFHKDFYVYDVRVDATGPGGTGGRFLDHEELAVWCDMRRLHMVPVLYVGPYDIAMINERLAVGPSVLDPDNTPVREGCVVRRLAAEKSKEGRMVRKVVSKEFLMRNAEAGGSEADELIVDPDAETAPIALAADDNEKGDAA